jgi:hypothetical protein
VATGEQCEVLMFVFMKLQCWAATVIAGSVTYELIELRLLVHLVICITNKIL